VTCPACSATPCSCSTRRTSEPIRTATLGRLVLSWFGDGSLTLAQDGDSLTVDERCARSLAAHIIVGGAS
jgi:hypothetical protein